MRIPRSHYAIENFLNGPRVTTVVGCGDIYRTVGITVGHPVQRQIAGNHDAATVAGAFHRVRGAASAEGEECENYELHVLCLCTFSAIQNRKMGRDERRVRVSAIVDNREAPRDTATCLFKTMVGKWRKGLTEIRRARYEIFARRTAEPIPTNGA